MHICKISGVESATSLKKDFLQGSRVFSGDFFKNFLNSFSEGYILEAVARRYSIREKPKKNFTSPEAVVRRCSVNKDVLKNFTKFTGKHLCQSLFFNKFAGLRLWHKCFSVNFVKISRTNFLKKTSRGCFNSYSVLDTLENLLLHQN